MWGFKYNQLFFISQESKNLKQIQQKVYWQFSTVIFETLQNVLFLRCTVRTEIGSFSKKSTWVPPFLTSVHSSNQERLASTSLTLLFAEVTKNNLVPQQGRGGMTKFLVLTFLVSLSFSIFYILDYSHLKLVIGSLLIFLCPLGCTLSCASRPSP